MTRFALAALAALISVAFAAPAVADPFTYANDMCKGKPVQNVTCMGVIEPAPYRSFVGGRLTFEEFLQINNLPADLTPDSIAPAFVVFVTSLTS